MIVIGGSFWAEILLWLYLDMISDSHEKKLVSTILEIARIMTDFRRTDLLTKIVSAGVCKK